MYYRSFLAVATVCVAAFVALAWALDVDLIDDSYIFLRYARNIAEGHGAVFNVGERVEGFSSPLWTLLLAASGAIVPHFEMLAYVLGMLCGAGIVILLLFGVSKTGPGLGWFDAIVLTLGFASSPMFVFWSGSGMDAGLFLLLVTAVLLSILSDRRQKLQQGGLSVRTAILLVLATLTRMEGVLLAGYAGFVFLYERRSIRVLKVYGIAIAAGLLVRYTYYGTWVPNTYHAKVTFQLLHRLSDGAYYVLPALQANVLLLVATVAVLIMAWRRRVHEQVPTIFLGGWILVWITYVLYVGGDNFALFRFLLPVLPALFLLLGLGWSAVRLRLSRPARYVCLAGLALAFAASNLRTYQAKAEGYYGDVRFTRAWVTVGRWVDRETPPDAVIATVVPGAMGYFGCRTTIDMLGLTDRSVSLDGKVFPRGGHGHARYNTDYLFQRYPDFIIYHSSGRFSRPVYDDPENIPVWSSYALYDFVTDPRCERLYSYKTVRLDNDTLIEMQVKKAPEPSKVVSTRF